MTERKVVYRRPKKEVPTPRPDHAHRAVVAPMAIEGYIERRDLGFIEGPTRRRACIGIDQSVNRYAITAFCPDDETAVIWLFKNPTSGARALSGMRRMLALERYVETIMGNLSMRCPEVLHICLEGYNRNARNWREEAGELSWMTRRMLIRVFGVNNQVAYPTIVAPRTLKKYVTSNGNGDKNLILKAVFQKWGIDVDDDNMADSYGLARLAAGIVTGQTAHKYEQDIVAKIGRHTEWEPLEPLTTP